MPDLIVTFIFAGLGSVAGGIGAISNGHYIGGPLRIAFGLLCLFLVFAPQYIHSPDKRYRFSVSDCPHKGDYPVKEMIKRGYHWYNYSIGEDESTLVVCEDCGFQPIGVYINPLTQISSKRLGIQAHPEFLPVHP